MNILFICRANVGRSQVAEAFYNSLVPEANAHSAGYAVQEKEGQPLHNFIIQGMKEHGLDLSNKVRKQLTEAMLKDHEMIIALFSKEEAPELLLKDSRVIYWDIADPAGKPIEEHQHMINEVKKRIINLIEQSN